MRIKILLISSFVVFLTIETIFAQKRPQTPPSPLYVDPIYNGTRDPEIVYNPLAKEYWVYYTSSRPVMDKGNFVGAPIGIAGSKDLINWRFVGYCYFNGIGGKPDAPHTYWAPGLFIEGDTAHMFVTYKEDTIGPWGGPSRLDHYKAPVTDMQKGWRFYKTITAEPQAIDASVIKIDNVYNIWYRNCIKDPCGIYHATSPDLVNWQFLGKAQGDINNFELTKIWYQEGPYVFRWKNYYWMITDPDDGIVVYRSQDANTWKMMGRILNPEGGKRPMDSKNGKHASVKVINDRAFIFYHSEPFMKKDTTNSFPGHKFTCYLQMAELTFDGEKINCDRDKPIMLPDIP
jgi:hypothetical protein